MAKEENQKKASQKKPKLRRYTVVEKKHIVAQIESGTMSFDAASDKYQVGKRSLQGWIATYAKDPHLSDKSPRHTAATRRQAALDVKAGVLTETATIRKYGVAKSTIRQWIDDFAANNSLMEEKQVGLQQNDTGVLQQIEDLQLKVSALETMIDMAEQEYNLDIRKKCGTKRQQD